MHKVYDLKICHFVSVVYLVYYGLGMKLFYYEEMENVVVFCMRILIWVVVGGERKGDYCKGADSYHVPQAQFSWWG